MKDERQPPESPTAGAEQLLANAQSQRVDAGDLVSTQNDLNDLDLKRKVGNWILILMLVQVGVADVVFVVYGICNGFHIPAAAITGWLGATVIEVISVVVIITQYLFPGEGAFKGGKK